MTIQVTCECGKELHAPDEFAGRQTRCPACQRPVTLPSPETAIQPTPSAIPAMASPGAERPIDPSPGSPATSKLALWSMILGIGSVCVPGILSIPALILGFLGLREIGRNPQGLGGKGMAIAGLALGGVMTAVGFVGVLAAVLLFPAVRAAREAAARITSVNNMKQMGLACHNYHDTFQYFPSETPGPKNPTIPAGSRLSWRVQILPYIEESGLAQEFHQDEPWDSPHNLKLLPRMPKLYLDPRFQSEADRAKGLTYYRGFVGPGGIFGAYPPANLRDITTKNGASNTLWIVEAGEPVPWTKPEDPSFNENSPFGGPNRVKLFAAGFADGHVQVLPQNFDRKMIGRMINWQNTEPVTLPP